jgi:hypothetical protein
MKMIFFLIAFFLVSIRVYFSWSGKDKERRGISESDMVIKSDNFYEEINYAGKFELADDEGSFKSISPGGYFKYRRNEEKVRAESNLQGSIEYTLFDGKDKLPMNEKGKTFLRESIHEMIVWGFDAQGHMQRVFQKGGVRALLSETDSMRSDPVKILYLRRLLAFDSLSSEERIKLISKTKLLGSDYDKRDFLNQFSAEQLKDPGIDSVYLNAVAGIGSDIDKIRIYEKLIDSSLMQGPMFDSLIQKIGGIGADIDKSNLYRKIIEKNNISEVQWISLIHGATMLGSDIDKANLLTNIGEKMPKTDELKAAYLKAAKSISNDSDYGKAVRIIQ